LASVPRSRWLRRPLGSRKEPFATDTEPFRRLASQLRHLPGDKTIRSVLVTSTGPKSGKTTVALHLAAAAAAGLGRTVFLLEADLRRPSLGRLLNLPSERGLSNLLENGNGDADAVQSVELDAGQLVELNGQRDASTNGHHSTPHGKLSLLLAGPYPENATSLLESETMRNLMRSYRRSYDLMVVDGPPPGIVADVLPLAKEVDAVIIVARLGKDTGPQLRRMRVELERLGIEPVGVVANFGRRIKNPYLQKGR
jgi:succinoglycan biosynthesis transport protein ExoP